MTATSWAEVAQGRGLLRAARRRQWGGRGEKAFGTQGPWWLTGMQWELLRCSGVEAEEEGSAEHPCTEPGQQQTGRAAGPWKRAAAGRMCSAPRADLSYLRQTLQGPSSSMAALALPGWGGGVRVSSPEVPRDGAGCRGVADGSHKVMGYGWHEDHTVHGWAWRVGAPSTGSPHGGLGNSWCTAWARGIQPEQQGQRTHPGSLWGR